ncbi:unnamed protein product [Lactuca virosa]|uniref:UEV domain-containing protein n=1 Tax=Lactuca virosa TaxID=75947 RepID=A0AAU9PNC4_9ASTR|nr:unnamed protein product [Lactuca virosa]
MVFQNATYNILVVIWLMETYPRHPLFVFVNPTRDMIIKDQHFFVNPSGLVSFPYLQNWVYPSSNLVELAPKSIQPTIPPRSYPPSPYGNASGSGRILSSSPPQRLGSTTEDPCEVFKRNAINKLVVTVHVDVEALRKNREVEMEGMFIAEAVLRQREEDVLKGLREMKYEKEALEQQLQMVLMNTDMLEGCVRENEGKLGGNTTNVNDDEAFEPSDPLSKQMLESTSYDLAIEYVMGLSHKNFPMCTCKP